MATTRDKRFLEFAERTARAAGKAILPHFRAALDVADKGGARGYDPVTIADHAAERGDPRTPSRTPIPITVFAARSSAGARVPRVTRG